MRVGFAGHAGAGKNTAAGMLAARLNAAGFVVALDAFAVELKRRVRRKYGWDGADKSDRWRKLLQDEGLSVRSGSPDYWVRQCHSRSVIGLRDAEVEIYTDVRYANEAAFVRQCGVLIWVVDRMAHLSPEAAGHPSEALDFDHDPADITLSNRGTLLQLDAEIKTIAEGLTAKLNESERKIYTGN